MDIVQKQRTKYTVVITVLSAIFLAILLGGLFGVVCATNDIFISKHLDKALASPLDYNENAQQGLRCFFVFEKDGNITYSADDLSSYSNDLDAIIASAIKTENGKFSTKNKYFVVKSTTFSGGKLYAVFDRTSYHEQLVNTAIMVVLLYCTSIILVALLALLSSTKLLYPVKYALEKQRDFIANTSHELKTPLTIISTNLNVIKSDPDSTIKDNETWISSIESQVGRMKDLITNMLELSRIEQSELPKQEFDFSSTVEGVCLSFDAVCFEKNISISSEIEQNIRLTGNEPSLERMVTTLLDNAIKYSNENGKIGIKLNVEQSKVHLAVLNTGEALTKEEAQHVFDRFYRTDGARKNEDQQSFGLGLAIAQSIVKAHDGTISCHGVEEKGTVFDVYIPLFKNRHSGSRAQKSAQR